MIENFHSSDVRQVEFWKGAMQMGRADLNILSR